MESRNETIEDILKEVRWRARLRPLHLLTEYDERLADRIESAWRREREALFTEAAENENSGRAIDTNDNNSTKPLRNCDVGTAEEQTTRYRKFCHAHQYLGSDFSYICKGFGKGRCPFFNSHTKSQCEFAWAQMPYEEGGKI